MKPEKARRHGVKVGMIGRAPTKKAIGNITPSEQLRNGAAAKWEDWTDKGDGRGRYEEVRKDREWTEEKATPAPEEDASNSEWECGSGGAGFWPEEKHYREPGEGTIRNARRRNNPDASQALEGNTLIRQHRSVDGMARSKASAGPPGPGQSSKGAGE